MRMTRQGGSATKHGPLNRLAAFPWGAIGTASHSGQGKDGAQAIVIGGVISPTRLGGRICRFEKAQRQPLAEAPPAMGCDCWAVAVDPVSTKAKFLPVNTTKNEASQRLHAAARIVRLIGASADRNCSALACQEKPRP
jgi:hypothetical protein